MKDGQRTASPADGAVPGRIDGRRLRSERTKQLIIEAYLALLRESPEIPTAAEIAKRAGYSVRSIFERFDDLLALSFAAADYALRRGWRRRRSAISMAIARRASAPRSKRGPASASSGSRCGGCCCTTSGNRPC